jgi:hypothetical protein
MKLSGPARIKKSPSNLTLILAAIAAAVSVGSAAWSFFGFWPQEERHAEVSTEPTATVSTTPSPDALISPSPTPVPAIDIVPDDYRVYNNEKFDFSISYPANFLIPQGESPNGDGQRFISKDGSVVMEVNATPETSDDSLKKLYEEAKEGRSDRAGCD